MYLNREENNSKGSVSLSVFLVSVAVTVCAVWLVALCGVCGWCQRKLPSGWFLDVQSREDPSNAARSFNLFFYILFLFFAFSQLSVLDSCSFSLCCPAILKCS
uniref:Synaptotagmin VIIa n=1 Tax=Gasterosteus aculeatus aculeatus TaxID=481459 RepID=A0AAQ4RVY5_GASAC